MENFQIKCVGKQTRKWLQRKWLTLKSRGPLSIHQLKYPGSSLLGLMLIIAVLYRIINGGIKKAPQCASSSSSSPPTDIIVDFEKIRNFGRGPLERVKNFTSDGYVGYLLDDAGKEHYTLLNYISAKYGDCRPFVDIGTRYVTSALALGSHESAVWTFDIPQSSERRRAFRGKTEAEWQRMVTEAGVNITFHNVDLLQASDDDFKTYFGTWFVLLDTFHKPYSQPFERELFQRMVDIGFKGLLMLDDIYFNEEMKKWWEEIKNQAERGNYRAHDLSEVGHWTGTGLVDFSGMVTVK